MPSTPQNASAPAEAHLNTLQRAIAHLSLLGNMGIQFNALLVPLVVLQITGSLSLAATAFFISWLPKLALYVTGGAFLMRFSPRHVHFLVDLLRVGSIAVITGCALFDGPYALVVAAATVYQCAGAVWVVLYERLVFEWWSDAERAHGHARMAQQFHFGSLLALSLGLVIPSIQILLGLALLAQTISCVMVWQLRHTLYSTTESKPVGAAEADSCPRINLPAQICADIKAVRDWRIIRFLTLNTLLALPFAFAGAGTLFYLERTLPGSSSNPTWPSALIITRTLAGLLVGFYTQRALSRARNDLQLLTLGFGLLLIGGVSLIFKSPLWVLFGAMAGVSAATYCWAPISRTWRQKTAALYVPKNSRAGVVGILMAFESGSNAVAAVLLALAGEHLALLSAIVLACGCTGLILLRGLIREHAAHSVPEHEQVATPQGSPETARA